MHTVVKVLLFAALLTNFAEGLYTPVYASFVEQIGGGLSDAGLSWSVTLIVFGILALVFSHLGMRGERKFRFLVGGYALGFIATLLFAFVTSPTQLYLVQFLRGLSWALFSPVWDAYFSLFVDRRRAAVEWGYYEGGWSIATGLGSAIGGVLVTLFGFKTMFLLCAVLNFSATFLVLAYRKEFM